MENEQILGIFTLISAIFGCITNWSVVLFFREIPVLRSSFGYLSAHGALITAAYCTIALFWIAPMMLFDIPWLETYSHYPGFFLYLFYDLATETHFLICLNRFFAVVLPHRYNSLFCAQSTAMFIVGLWIFCGLIALLVFPFSGCRMYYEKSVTTLMYTNTPTCQELTFLADFGLHMLVVAVMIVLNSITFWQFRRKNRVVLSVLTHASSLRKAQSERNFLRQTFFQESFYTVALLTYFLLAPLLEQEWLRFLIILLPWYFVHAFEAMVTILCNPELKKLCFRKWKLCFATPEKPVTVEAWRSTTTHVFKF